MALRRFWFLMLMVLLSACFPLPGQREALETEIAGKIYQTLTAAVPPATPTPEFTMTPPFTSTPLPSPTPLPQAVVMSANLNLREGPGFEYTPIKLLVRGDLLEVVGTYAECGWLKVRTPDGGEGWVKGDSTYVSYKEDCRTFPAGTFRPANGTIISDRRKLFGPGELKVQNGGDQDGVVALTDSVGNLLVAFYVRQGATFTLTRIADGSYQLYFTLGSEWIGDELKFLNVFAVKRMDELLAFATTGTSYTTWEVSLQPVPGGTARASDIPESEFPALK